MVMNGWISYLSRCVYNSNFTMLFVGDISNYVLITTIIMVYIWFIICYISIVTGVYKTNL